MALRIRNRWFRWALNTSILSTIWKISIYACWAEISNLTLITITYTLLAFWRGRGRLIAATWTFLLTEIISWLTLITNIWISTCIASLYAFNTLEIGNCGFGDTWSTFIIVINKIISWTLRTLICKLTWYTIYIAFCTLLRCYSNLWIAWLTTWKYSEISSFALIATNHQLLI